MLVLALSTLLFPAPLPQVNSPDLIQVVARAGDPIVWAGSTASETYALDSFDRLNIEPSGAWTAIATARTPIIGGASNLTRLVIGQDAAELDQPVRVVREPNLYQTFFYSRITDAVRAGGQLAYIEDFVISPDQSSSVWIDDTKVLTIGDPVVGSPGWTWSFFYKLDYALNGRLLVEGSGRDSAGNTYNFLADITAGEVLINSLDFYPNVPRRIAGLLEFDLSANGAHWAAIGIMNFTGDRVLLVDGEIFAFDGGRFALEKAPAPPAYEAEFGPSTILGITATTIADDGTVTTAYSMAPVAHPFNNRVMRGNKLVPHDALPTARTIDVEIDRSGAVVTLDRRSTGSFDNPTLRSESTLIMQSLPDLDLDFDGVADLSSNQWVIDFDELGRGNRAESVMGIGCIRTVAQDCQATIFRTAPASYGAEFCNSRRNSTGRVGRMIAPGSRLVSDNAIDLRVFDLPTNALGFALFSRTSGPEIQPGNSEGVVCLSGDIGRYLPGLFVTDATGTGRITPDLQAVPQPNGTPAAVMAGETWFMQTWHRDTAVGAATSNFTTAVAVRFL